jgi:hypothetical protein
MLLDVIGISPAAGMEYYVLYFTRPSGTVWYYQYLILNEFTREELWV